MQPVKPISVIFFGSISSNEARILKYAQDLCSKNWRADILCYDPEGATESAKLLGDVHVRSASDLGVLLDVAYFETIAIVQGNPDVDLQRVNELVRRLDPLTFVCDYKKTKTRSGYKRGLMWGYRALSEGLLKSAVGSFDDAILFFQRSEDSVLAVRAAAKPPVAGFERQTNIAQLVSGLKMVNKYRVVPVNDEFASAQVDESVNSKTIFRAIKHSMRCWWNLIMFPQPVEESIGQSNSVSRRVKVGGWILLCLITALMLNQNLRFPLFEPDEARNAQLALNIVDSNIWTSLSLKNDHYWDKPPLVAWMTAISFKTFGVTENAARFPGVIVTFLTVIFTCAIGQRLVGFRAAWIAAILALLSLGIPFSGRFLTMDSTLTLMTTVTLLAAYRGSFGRRFRQAWWVAAGVCVGLGMMAKGPVILVLCAPPVIAYCWLTRRKLFGSPKKSLYFAVPAVLIGCPWFIATAIGTPEFLSYFFWEQNVVRFTQGLAHHQPFWFYLPVILLLMFPASHLFLPLVRFIGTRKSDVRSQRTEAHGYLLLCALWVVVFFSFSTDKLPTYILPAVPMLCLLMASVIDINVFAKIGSSDVVNKNGAIEVKYIDSFYARLPKWFAINTAAWVIIVSFGILCFLPDYRASVVVMVASLILLIVSTIVASNKRSHPYVAWAGVGVLGLFFSAMLVNHVIPAVSSSRSIQNAIAEINDREDLADMPVVYYARDSFASAITLSDRNVVYFSRKETDSAATFLKHHPNALLVAGSDYIDGLVKAVRADVALVKDESVRHFYRATPTGVLSDSRIADAATSSDSELLER